MASASPNRTEYLADRPVANGLVGRETPEVGRATGAPARFLGPCRNTHDASRFTLHEPRVAQAVGRRPEAGGAQTTFHASRAMRCAGWRPETGGWRGSQRIYASTLLRFYAHSLQRGRRATSDERRIYVERFLQIEKGVCRKIRWEMYGRTEYVRRQGNCKCLA
jgi:hypothetical protein